MKRISAVLASFGLLVLSMTGCHHTAGACDCHHHGHMVGHAHPVMGVYGNHPLQSHHYSMGAVEQAGAAQPEAGEKLAQPPKPAN